MQNVRNLQTLEEWDHKSKEVWVDRDYTIDGDRDKRQDVLVIN